ncbi:hypothetical protein PTTG_26297, partial [Puccinia triticina 1-1 BBBD Race 1]
LRPPERTRPGTVERMGPRITLSGGLLRKGLRLTHIRTEHSTTRPIYTVSPRSPNNERTNDGWRTSWIPGFKKKRARRPVCGDARRGDEDVRMDAPECAQHAPHLGAHPIWIAVHRRRRFQ